MSEADQSYDRKFARYLSICDDIAKEAQCNRRRVGAIVVWQEMVTGSGYNKPPMEKETRPCNQGGCPRGTITGAGDRNYRDCISAHAEWIAIIQAGDIFSRNADLYVNSRPCHTCIKMAFVAGVKMIVFRNEQQGIELYLKEHMPWIPNYLPDLPASPPADTVG